MLQSRATVAQSLPLPWSADVRLLDRLISSQLYERLALPRNKGRSAIERPPDRGVSGIRL